MSVSAVLIRERRSFCETLDEVGPNAPSLCEGWTSIDIAAHVQATESLAGVPVLAAYATSFALIATFTRLRPWAQVQFTRLMERQKADGFAALVTRLRHGPPPILRVPFVGDVRLCEEWVHHEDIRRAGGHAEVRVSDPELDSHLWRVAVFDGLLQTRRFGHLGVTLADLDGHHSRISRGRPQIRVRGAPGELLLWVLGRQSAAHVDVEGPIEAVEILNGVQLGL